MFAHQIVMTYLQNPSAESLDLAIFTLEAANLPWTHEQIGLLKKKKEQLEQQEMLENQAQLLLGASTLGALGQEGGGGGIEQQLQGLQQGGN